MINIQNISKKYDSVQALKDISFEVNKGEIFGLLGPDGAGKTTLFRILTTLILADSGTATLNGWDIVQDYDKIRKNIGYMPGRFSLYLNMTIEENLDFFATLFHTTIEENYDLIKDIRPKIVFLDEPTGGVDPAARRQFWELIYKSAADGITVFVTTHYMDEAEYCNRVSIMVDGRLDALDTPTNLKQHFEAVSMDEVFTKLARKALRSDN